MDITLCIRVSMDTFSLDAVINAIYGCRLGWTKTVYWSYHHAQVTDVHTVVPQWRPTTCCLAAAV